MRECKKVGVVTVELCPVCAKSEKAEVQVCISAAEKTLASLKTQIRAWKRRIKQIERAEAKATEPKIITVPQATQNVPQAQATA